MQQTLCITVNYSRSSNTCIRVSPKVATITLHRRVPLVKLRQGNLVIIQDTLASCCRPDRMELGASLNHACLCGRGRHHAASSLGSRWFWGGYDDPHTNVVA